VFQGLGCSPIKMVRELGLERCETVRFLSTNYERKKLEFVPLIRKECESIYLWLTGCGARRIAGSLRMNL